MQIRLICNIIIISKLRRIIMPRPKTKAELINAAELNYSKLCDMIEEQSEKKGENE